MTYLCLRSFVAKHKTFNQHQIISHETFLAITDKQYEREWLIWLNYVKEIDAPANQ